MDISAKIKRNLGEKKENLKRTDFEQMYCICLIEIKSTFNKGC